ncbi:MAG: carbohydrate porin [Candidatus Latescibacterota bacterium]
MMKHRTAMIITGLSILSFTGTALAQVNAVPKEEKRTVWFEKFEIALGATGILQGSSRAGKRLNSEGKVTDGSMSFDLDITTPVRGNSTVYTHFEAGNGDGIDGNILTLSGLNNNADPNARLRPTEFWYEHTWFDGRLRCRMGKIDLTTDLDCNAVANSEVSQFLSTGFVNNLAVEFPDDNGMGALVQLSPNPFFDIRIGFAEADADWDDILDDVFSIMELDFKPKFGPSQGNIRGYVWLNGKEHEDLRDSLITGKDNFGFGVSYDHELAGIAVIFTRYGWQRGRVSLFDQAWSAGLQYSGKQFGRDEDVFGLAYGKIINSSDWKDFARTAGIYSGNEIHVELYYRFKANDTLFISPDIQWVRNAEGNQKNDTLWTFGLRTQISY